MIFEEFQLQELFAIDTTGTGNGKCWVGNKTLAVLGNPDEII
jgi:hypothetical protein